VRLDAGFHVFATLSPRDGEDGAHVALQGCVALDKLFDNFGKNHFCYPVGASNDVFWPRNGWSHHVGGEKWCQVRSVGHRLPGVRVQSLDRFSVLSAVTLFFETLENMSTHAFGVALENGAAASRRRLLRRASRVLSVRASATSAVSVRAGAPGASAAAAVCRWAIGLNQAKQTIKVTTQRDARSAILPLSRRYRMDRMYHHKKLTGPKFYTDTLFGRCKSVSNNTCAQIFANEHQFVKAYPMGSKAMAGKALRHFIRDFGDLERLISDCASEQVGPNTDFMKNIRKYEIEHHVSEPGRPQQNRAESVIREVNGRWFRLMVKQKVPKRLWLGLWYSMGMQIDVLNCKLLFLP
jgi:hypothetical protein